MIKAQVSRSLVRADAMLLLAALIWGSTFVAQRMAMASMDPFAFNGCRFGLGALVLVPWCLPKRSTRARTGTLRQAAWAGVLGGMLLFGGASLQQIGMVFTTAGNGGFITGLYVVLVPIIVALSGRRVVLRRWLSAVVALYGLSLLTGDGDANATKGDWFIFGSAWIWALHILVVSHFSRITDPIRMAAIQAATCAVLSLIVSFLFETPKLSAVSATLGPIAYAGILSVGLAFTLQVVAQKKAPAVHAAVIMSLESVFAALTGAVVLGEMMSAHMWIGAGLMFAAMINSAIGRELGLGRQIPRE
ncbi:MAG: DMT family transporter [Verrucomicrobia bacterium]|nr:DMT family transporter [Verrucomicrobiota bacterium]